MSSSISRVHDRGFALRVTGALLSLVLVLMVSFVAVDTDALYYYKTVIHGATQDGYTTAVLDGNGQSQAFVSNYNYLESVQLYLILTGSPTGTLKVSLMDGETELVLSDIDVSAIPNADWYDVPLSHRLSTDRTYTIRLSFERGRNCPSDAQVLCVMNPSDTTVSDPASTTFTVTESAGEQGAILLGFGAKGGRTVLMIGWCILMASLFALLVSAVLLPECRVLQWFHTGRLVRSERAKKVFLILICIVWFLLLIPNVVYRLDSVSLDPSWRYFLNIANGEGYVFGDNAFFTYGPLGFLCCLMNLGNAQYIFGLFVWACLFAVHIALLTVLCRYVLEGRLSLFAFVLSFLCYLPNIHDTQTDNYMLYLLLLAVAVWKIGDRKRFATVVVNALLCLMFFCKFSTFTNSVAFLVVFIALELIFERQKRALLLLLPACVLAPVLYLLYNPSVRDLIAYVSGVLKISSGWMKTQQWDDMYSLREFCCLVAIIILYLLVIALTLLLNRHRSGVLIAGCVSLFMAYKYGVGAHGMPMSIWLTSMLFSVFFLCLPVQNPAGKTMRPAKRGLLLALTACCLSIAVLQEVNIRVGGTDLEAIAQGKLDTAAHLSKSSLTEKLKDQADIPQEMIDTIGDATVSVYPWRTAYNTIYPSLHMVYGPSVQNCNLFIPWLDELEARYYRSDEAPEYLIFHDGTIFNHLKGLENPLTFEAMVQNYETCLTGGDLILLKRKTPEEEPEKTLLQSCTYGSGDLITCPQGADFCVIHMTMTTGGKLKDLFFRAGMTSLRMDYEDGRSDAGTLVVPNLESGFYLQEYPQTMERTAELFSGASMPKVTSFQLGGTALACYEKTITIDWYSVD